MWMCLARGCLVPLYDSTRVNYETTIIVLGVVWASSRSHTSIDPTGSRSFFLSAPLLVHRITIITSSTCAVLPLYLRYTRSLTRCVECWMLFDICMEMRTICRWLRTCAMQFLCMPLPHSTIGRLRDFSLPTAESHTEDYTHSALTNTCVRAIAVICAAHGNTKRQPKRNNKKSPYSHVVLCCHRQFPAPATERRYLARQSRLVEHSKSTSACIALARHDWLYVLPASETHITTTTAFVVDGSGCDRR